MNMIDPIKPTKDRHSLREVLGNKKRFKYYLWLGNITKTDAGNFAWIMCCRQMELLKIGEA